MTQFRILSKQYNPLAPDDHPSSSEVWTGERETTPQYEEILDFGVIDWRGYDPEVDRYVIEELESGKWTHVADIRPREETEQPPEPPPFRRAITSTRTRVKISHETPVDRALLVFRQQGDTKVADDSIELIPRMLEALRAACQEGETFERADSEGVSEISYRYAPSNS